MFLTMPYRSIVRYYLLRVANHTEMARKLEGVSIRIDREVWHALKVRAAEQNVSVGKLATEMLSKILEPKGS